MIDSLKCPTCPGRVTDEDHMQGPHVRPCPTVLKPLVAEYHEGETIRSLATKYSVSQGVIRRRLIWGGANLRNEYPRHIR